jgi:hypothetical protein
MNRCKDSKSNSDEPFVELTLSATPGRRGRRLWGVVIVLPQNEELANLFYQSTELEFGGGFGYRLTVYAPDGSEVPCLQQSEQESALRLRSDRQLEHLCAHQTTEVDAIYQLMHAYRLRITLIGVYRQIWLKTIRVYEVDMPVQPRKYIGPVKLYDTPPSTPLTTLDNIDCKRVGIRSVFNDMKLVHEFGCKRDASQCCHETAALKVNGKDYGSQISFQLDDAGCCTAISNTTPALTVDRNMYLRDSGTYHVLSLPNAI